jgi:hypothetical protein
MKELIKQIIKEETSTQTKLMSIIKRFGIDYGAKVVGGYDRLAKIMEGTDYIYIRLDISDDAVGKYLDGDRNWGKTSLYRVILVEPYDIHYWGEYDVQNLMEDIDDVNLNNIRSILSEDNGDDLSDVSIDELLEYDTFRHITDAINNAANTVDGDAYGDYLYNQLKKAFEEYGGEVFSMGDGGVTFSVNLTKYIKDVEENNPDELKDIFRICGDDNFTCVFNEMVYNDWTLIDKPKPYFDENWYNNDFNKEYFNEILYENLSEHLN